jgi:DNA-binding NarL/FixJ family response regulator
MGKTYVVLHDHPGVAEGLRRLLIDCGTAHVHSPLTEAPSVTDEESLWQRCQELAPDGLIVEANLRFAGRPRSARYGLRLAEEFRRRFPQPILVLSFEPEERLQADLTRYVAQPEQPILNFGQDGLTFLRLPTSKTEWQAAEAALGLPLSPDQHEPLKIALQQARAAEADAAFRHSLKGQSEGLPARIVHAVAGRAAAVRILHGALYAGYLNRDRYLEILGILADRSASEPDAQVIHDYHKKVERDETGHSVFRDERQLPRVLWQRVLLIDDDAERFGWDVILGDLFGRHLKMDIEAVISVAVGLQRLGIQREGETVTTQPSDNIAAVLLDVHFADGSSGRDTLEKIKKQQSYRPIVMFTADAYDSILTRACHGLGAKYFVKQYPDDRDPVAYTEALCETVAKAIETAWAHVLDEAVKALYPGPFSSPEKKPIVLRYLESAITQIGQSLHAAFMLCGLAFGCFAQDQTAWLKPNYSDGFSFVTLKQRVEDGLKPRLSGLLRGLPEVCLILRNIAMHEGVDETNLTQHDVAISLWSLLALIKALRVGAVNTDSQVDAYRKWLQDAVQELASAGKVDSQMPSLLEGLWQPTLEDPSVQGLVEIANAVVCRLTPKKDWRQAFSYLRFLKDDRHTPSTRLASALIWLYADWDKTCRQWVQHQTNEYLAEPEGRLLLALGTLRLSLL